MRISRRLFLYCAIGAAWFALSSGCTSRAQTPFTGTLIYEASATYHGDNPRHKRYYEQEKYGDTVIVSVSPRGCFLRQYPGAKQYGYEFTLYDPTTNIQYAGFRFMDTILANTANKDVVLGGELSSSQIDSAGQTFGRIKYTARDTASSVDVFAVYMYPLNGSLAVDPAIWSDNEEFGTNRLFALSESHWNYALYDYGSHAIELRLAKRVTGNVSDAVCTLPQGRPVKLTD